MSKPKPRPYRVEKARLEHAHAIVWATSAAEAERIARDEWDIEWEFNPGSQVYDEKAHMLRGDARAYNADYGYQYKH